MFGMIPNPDFAQILVSPYSNSLLNLFLRKILKFLVRYQKIKKISKKIRIFPNSADLGLWHRLRTFLGRARVP